MRTAVEVGHRDGPIERYELANLCTACDEAMTTQWRAEAEVEAQNMQSLGRLVLAFIVGGLLYSIGWPHDRGSRDDRVAVVYARTLVDGMCVMERA
jgi:hypothetical protein